MLFGSELNISHRSSTPQVAPAPGVLPEYPQMTPAPGVLPEYPQMTPHRATPNSATVECSVSPLGLLREYSMSTLNCVSTLEHPVLCEYP